MKILTWNLSHIKSNKSWPYAVNRIDADILILQESYHPLTYLTHNEYWSIQKHAIWEPTERGWGNSIITKNIPITHVEFEHSFKGRILIGTVNSEIIGSITIVNVHVPITGNYSRYNLQKMFIEIEPFIQQGKSVVAGDLNFGECFDKPGKTEHHDIMNNLLKKHGLMDCYKKFYSQQKQTFRPPKRPESQICIDYILITEDLGSVLRNCEVLSGEEITLFSDHNPIIAVLE